MNPTIKDDAFKNVNRLLAKEKIMQHVEQYLIDFTPGVAFEQYLVHNVLSHTGKVHPYELNFMRSDFKAFLADYMESLYAIFEFYILEYQSLYP